MATDAGRACREQGSSWLGPTRGNSKQPFCRFTSVQATCSCTKCRIGGDIFFLEKFRVTGKRFQTFQTSKVWQVGSAQKGRFYFFSGTLDCPFCNLGYRYWFFLSILQVLRWTLDPSTSVILKLDGPQTSVASWVQQKRFLKMRGETSTNNTQCLIRNSNKIYEWNLTK